MPDDHFVDAFSYAWSGIGRSVDRSHLADVDGDLLIREDGSFVVLHQPDDLRIDESGDLELVDGRAALRTAVLRQLRRKRNR